MASKAERDALLRWRLTPKSEADLKIFSAKLGSHGSSRAIRQQLRNHMFASAKPSLDRVRRAARQLPSRGIRSAVYGRRDLRERIARATKLENRTKKDPGVVIAVDKNRMDDAPTVPQLMNVGAWNRPVYGGPGWARQTSQQGWFDNSAKEGQKEIQLALVKMVQDFTRKISF